MDELAVFHELKKCIETTYKSRNPECDIPITEWKRREIESFQEDLQMLTKGTISERWFYTHIKKGQSEKLPRIDTLDLLSQYCGYRHWRDFMRQRTESLTVPEIKPSPLSPAIIGTIAALLLLSLGIGWKAFYASEPHCEICFLDSDYAEPIKQDLQVHRMLSDGKMEPIPLQKGCVLVNVKDEISLIVDGPYFTADTFHLALEGNESKRELQLKPDNYALMIHIFSNSAIEDYQKRRAQLSSMLSDRAQVFQIRKNNKLGMEMYNKADFIDKMTMPLKSLRNIEILETQYEKNQIVYMKFVQNEIETTP